MRRTVLVVDADPQSLRIVDVSLRRAGFDVQAASDGNAAAALIDRTPPPDLVIADVDLPGLDGFELCRRAKARPAKIPFVFLARPNTADRIKSVELGADDYLSKPVFVKEVVGRVSALLQRHERERLSSSDSLTDHVAGNLGDLSMIDLLQSIASNGRSGVLHLRAAAGAHGEVYFRKGAVVDAEVGRLSGADAVYRLLSWTDGRFEIEWRNIRRRDTVVLSAPALLMEGMRRLDEWTRQLRQLPPLETVFEVDYRLLAERLADIPDEVNGILRLFDGVRTAIQVIDDCGLSDLEALTVIGKLSHERLIRGVSADSADDDGKTGPELEGWLSASTDGSRPGAAAAVTPSDTGDTDARMRRASDQSLAARPAVPSAVERLPSPVPPPPDRREWVVESRPSEPRHGESRHGEQRHDERSPASDRMHADAVPELRSSDEPAVVIPFPSSSSSSSSSSLRQTLTSASGGPVAAVAGEISNGVPTSSTAAPASGPTLSGVSIPRSTDPGIGPVPRDLPPVSAPPAAPAAPVAVSTPVAPAVPQVPPAALHAPSAAMAVPVAPVPAPTPSRRDSSPRVPELPFSDSASRWMTEGDEIHTGRTKSEALEELALPSRFRGLGLIVGVVIVAALSFWGLKVLRGRPAAESSADKTSAPPATASPPTPAIPTAGSPSAALTVEPAAPVPSAPTENPGPPSGTEIKPAGAAALVPEAAATTQKPPGEGGEAVAESADAPRLLAACQSAFSAGRMKDATTACTAAAQASPESAKALSLLAHAEFNRSHRKEALSWAEKAIKIDPKLADAYVIIGGVQQDAGRNADAKTAYRKYLELAPKGQYAPDLRAIVDSL